MRLESKYLAVKSLNEEKSYPIITLCAILELNRSSYYKWLHRNQSEQEIKDKELIDSMCILYQESNGIFDYRRMQLNLKRRFNLHYNKKRVYRIMKVIGVDDSPEEAQLYKINAGDNGGEYPEPQVHRPKAK